MEIDKNVISAINRYDPDIFDSTPLSIIHAVKEGKLLKMNPKNVYHFRNVGITSTVLQGHGESTAMATFKDLFFSQQLKHLQEVIAKDRALNYRGLGPAENAGLMTDLTQQKDHIEKEIKMWRDDPNHVAFFPVPLQALSFSGEARNLFLANEIQMSNDFAIVGLEVPREFVYGSIGNYTSASVSLRMLENRFVIYVEQLNDFIRNFIVPKIAAYYKINVGDKEKSIKFKKFKMADDTDYRNYMLNLVNLGALSKETLLEATTSYDSTDEKKKIEQETIEMAKWNAEGQAVSAEKNLQVQMENEAKRIKANQELAEKGKLPEEELFDASSFFRHPQIEIAADSMYKAIRAGGYDGSSARLIIESQQRFPNVFKRMLEKYPQLAAMIAEMQAAYAGDQSMQPRAEPIPSVGASSKEESGVASSPQVIEDVKPSEKEDTTGNRRPPKI